MMSIDNKSSRRGMTMRILTKESVVTAKGAVSMIVNTPPSLQQFSREFGMGLTKRQRGLLPMLLTGLLLLRGKRTQAALGRVVKKQKRHRSSISRLLRRARFRTRDLHKAICRKLIDMIDPIGKKAKLMPRLIKYKGATSEESCQRK